MANNYGDDDRLLVYPPNRSDWLLGCFISYFHGHRCLFRYAMLQRDIDTGGVSVRLSVCLSVRHTLVMRQN